jgi:hypothetical protein
VDVETSLWKNEEKLKQNAEGRIAAANKRLKREKSNGKGMTFSHADIPKLVVLNPSFQACHAESIASLSS